MADGRMLNGYIDRPSSPRASFIIADEEYRRRWPSIYFGTQNSRQLRD
jgi:hypothetical protein